jgi:hypothetical protein
MKSAARIPLVQPRVLCIWAASFLLIASTLLIEGGSQADADSQRPRAEAQVKELLRNACGYREVDVSCLTASGGFVCLWTDGKIHGTVEFGQGSSPNGIYCPTGAN